MMSEAEMADAAAAGQSDEAGSGASLLAPPDHERIVQIVEGPRRTSKRTEHAALPRKIAIR